MAALVLVDRSADVATALRPATSALQQAAADGSLHYPLQAEAAVPGWCKAASGGDGAAAERLLLHAAQRLAGDSITSLQDVVELPNAVRAGVFRNHFVLSVH